MDVTIFVTVSECPYFNRAILFVYLYFFSNYIAAEILLPSLYIRVCVQVMIGQSLFFAGEESNNWMVSFISESEQSLNVAVIAGAIGSGFVFMLIVVVALVLVIVGLWVRFNRLSKNLKEDAVRY